MSSDVLEIFLNESLMTIIILNWIQLHMVVVRRRRARLVEIERFNLFSDVAHKRYPITEQVMKKNNSFSGGFTKPRADGMCGILTTFEVAVQTICPDRRHPISLDGGCDTYVAANKGSVEGLLLNYFCIFLLQPTRRDLSVQP